jgi:hypothetical protein
MKIPKLRGSRSYGSPLTRKPRRPSLVKILRRAWTSALFWRCEVWSESELQQQSQHRTVTGDYSCHDQHPVFIPAFTQHSFYWHEWLTSSSRKTEIVRHLSSFVRSDKCLTTLKPSARMTNTRTARLYRLDSNLLPKIS